MSTNPRPPVQRDLYENQGSHRLSDEPGGVAGDGSLESGSVKRLAMESSAGAAAVLQYMYRRFCRRFPYLEKVYPSDHTVNGFLRSVQRLGSLVVIDPEMMHLAAQEMAVDPVEADGSIVEPSTLCRLMPQELLMMASAAV